MRAGLIAEIGADAVAGTIDEPVAADGELVVEMVAAALNPVDLAIAGGGFYAGHPTVPYVPGIEATGRDPEGRLVYAMGGGAGIARNGTVAERFVMPAAGLIELPDGAEPAMAAALGTAGAAGWLPLSWRAGVGEGDIVLVLGATGTAGRVAVQAARALGAGRVVAAGRNKARLEQVGELADATVWLGEADLGAKLTAACEPGASVVYDPLWGEPFQAALAAAAPDARIVQMGASAGPTAVLPSAAVRGKRLSVLGYSNFGVPRETFVEAYLTMVRRAIDGALDLDVVVSPLDEVGRAWAGLRGGSVKHVVVP